MQYRTEGAARGRVAVAAVVFACLLIAGLGVWLQSRVHVNHDVAWIAHSAAWMLDGRRFGSDILDPNPPMAWFAMLPAAAVARSGLLSEVASIQVWCWLLVLGAMALTAAMVTRLAPVVGPAEAVVALLMGVGALCILPVGDFGQREVIAFAYLLPYAFALMCRVGGAPLPGPVLGILVGVGAGIAVCLKPFLIAVPLLAEATYMVLTRSVWSVVRTETTAMAGVGAAYAVAVAVFARDYLDVALPMVSAAYWAYEGPGYLVQSRFRDAAMPALYAIGIAAVTWSFTRMHALLLAAIGGYSISYWIQYKGFPYHAYPVLAAACLLLAYTVAHASRSLLRKPWVERVAIRRLTVLALLAVAVPVLAAPWRDAMSWYRNADRQQGEWGLLREEPAARLRELGIERTDYLFALSTHPHPAFPTVSYLGARWSGRSVAQFVVPAYARRSEVGDAKLLAAIDRSAESQVEGVVADLTLHRPEFVLVEARQRRLGLGFRRFDDIAFYSRDPRFVRAWACYTELAPIGQIRLFRLRGDCEGS
ncbi:MAG: hypothetical protein ACT4UP_08065 [Gammaproteobacteria bacterium]